VRSRNKRTFQIFFFKKTTTINSPTIIICSMDDVRQCKTCGKSDTETRLEDRRTECSPCRQQTKEKATSATYQMYLKGLHIGAKSKVANKKRTQDLEFTIEREDLNDLWVRQEGRCAISGVFLTHHRDGSGVKEYNASIDRISSIKGYTPDNIQLVTYRINLMKHTLPGDMFYWWIKTIHDFSCD